jgi:hypothetical protein
LWHPAPLRQLLQFLLLLFAGWVNGSSLTPSIMQKRRIESCASKCSAAGFGSRTNSADGNRLIVTPPDSAGNDNGPIGRRERLGGLLNFYYRRAA